MPLDRSTVLPLDRSIVLPFALSFALPFALSLALSIWPGIATADAGPFWFDDPAPSDRWRLILAGEGVSDRVAHAPNAEGGGYDETRHRPRFLGGSLAVEGRVGERWALRAGLGRRSLTSRRDRYEIDGGTLSLARQLTPSSAPLRFTLVADLRANRASELYKNSWTSLVDARLTEARLMDARDEGATIALAARYRLGARLGLSARLGAGLTRTSHARLTGRGDADGCRYDFEAADGRGELTLLEPCDGLETFNERYPNEDGIEERLGFAPGRDLEHSGRFVASGLRADARVGRADVTLAWLHTFHDRPTLDDRLRARGQASIASSHTFELRTGFSVTPAFGLRAGVHYRSTAYLDELPLLYGAFTAERFARNTLSFSAGVVVAF